MMRRRTTSLHGDISDSDSSAVDEVYAGGCCPPVAVYTFSSKIYE